MSDLEKIDEEFNNFMYRVNEVNSIVKKLNSNDKKLQEIGTLEADKYLKEIDTKVLESIDEKDVVLNVKTNRTLINRKALEKDDNKDEATMSQEAFMAEVSKDADKRFKDRMVRKEKMETFKKQATLAFRRGEYEKALNCYNKAIEQIRDSCMLYCNRCLTFIKLKLYESAVRDAKTATSLNESSLKARLLLAKAHFLNGDCSKFDEAVQEAKEQHPLECDFIEEFVRDLKIQQGTIE